MFQDTSSVLQQICFVVPSVDDAVRIWHAKYGVGPWTLLNLAPDDPQVDGRDDPYAFRAAIATWGPIQLELIEPLDDRSHYAQSLAAHAGKPHFHHIKITNEDYHAAFDELLASGHQVVQSGRVGETAFAYFSLGDETGCTIEQASRRPGERPSYLTEGVETYPPQ
jgi:methylmalonyl-CoA/ethylmalonyl-CoA epimerase